MASDLHHPLRDSSRFIMKALNETSRSGIIHNTKSILNAKPITGPAASVIGSKQINELPYGLQTNMEKSFGQSLSDVTIHKNSSKAVQLKSLAFTQGNHIHFAPGQFDPVSEKGRNLIGHEMTHVLQQRSGRAGITHTSRTGVQLNHDHSLEQEADNFGKSAVKGQSVGQFSGTKGRQNNGNVIQCKTDTPWGDWSVSKYDLTQDVNSQGQARPASQNYRGADIKLNFKPKATVDAELIGLTQSVNSIRSGSVHSLNPTIASRSISNTDARTINGQSDEGAHIDMSADYNNPIYAVASKPSTSLDDPNTGAIWGQHGWHYQNAAGPQKRDGILIDRPTLRQGNINSSQVFETTALATKGAQTGMYYGSVKWGWKSDSAGNPSKIPFEVVNDGVPTSTFMKSAELWNNSATPSGDASIDLPIQWTGTIHNTPSLGLRTGPSSTNTLIADMPRNAAVTVMEPSGSWLKVQLDTSQSGVVINATGRSQVLTGNLLRGYAHANFIQKDSAYQR